jgi:DeoR family glycerol-3-phosphate regulon repressor
MNETALPHHSYEKGSAAGEAAGVLDERQAVILELVRERGFAAIEALAGRFAVTPQTIRRAANRLCEQGLLRRVHGGVALPAPAQNLAYEGRQVLNLAAKQRIARAAAAFLPDGASLFIGLGTTPEQVALALADRRDLHVITNSLNVAAALGRNPAIEITIAGGTLRPRDRDVIGDAAAAFFARFKADFGVFGVGGIDEDGTLLDFHLGEVEARQAMRANCRTSVLVADGSKFGRNATARGGRLGEVDHFFTDAAVPPAYAGLVAESRARLHVAAVTPAAA